MSEDDPEQHLSNWLIVKFIPGWGLRVSWWHPLARHLQEAGLPSSKLCSLRGAHLWRIKCLKRNQIPASLDELQSLSLANRLMYALKKTLKPLKGLSCWGCAASADAVLTVSTSWSLSVDETSSASPRLYMPETPSTGDKLYISVGLKADSNPWQLSWWQGIK